MSRPHPARSAAAGAAILVAAIIAGGATPAATAQLPGPVSQTVPVTLLGQPVGSLAVTDYFAGRNFNDDAYADITANFDRVDPLFGLPLDPNSEGLQCLNTLFPFGLAYMQVVTFDFASGAQQRIARDASGLDITVPVSDSPQLGFRLPAGGTLAPLDDSPYYGVTHPSNAFNAAGALPPDFDWDADDDPNTGPNGRELTAQFYDGPNLPFEDTPAANGDPLIQGLANLLNFQAGAIRFETALVGVIDAPGDDNPAVTQTNLLNGEYEVAVLKSFDWGIRFIPNVVDGSALDGLTASDYIAEPLPLFFADTVSADFEQAFDGQGPSGSIEWLVDFVDPVKPIPEPASLALLAAAAPFAARRRRKG